MPPTPLERVSIVLVGTKHAGNVGAVARAMHNMGLDDLRLVAPRCTVGEEGSRLARAGTVVLERARRYRTLRSALRGIHLVIGTSARAGGNRRQVAPPRAVVARILGAARSGRAALVFGPEDTGLVDDDLLLCQLLVRIPTAPEAASLNLAQAVMVLSYELRLGAIEHEPVTALPLAGVQSVEQMYAQFEAALLEIGFLHAKNARHMMFQLRRLLGRAGLTPADVGMLRGIARQIAWYRARPAR